jgi:DNA mismatch repair protein MutS
VRKQTVKNAERYITDELKQYESEVLSAEERAHALEARLFDEIRERAATHIPRLQSAAAAAAAIDVLAGFASVATGGRYVRPMLDEANVLHIDDGRHPVLDQTLADRFVPNSAHLTEDNQRVLVITGPNMAGKSTYIRQTALLVLLAQTGSFVPARAMRWGLADRLFARVGASDEITRGQSTFMVEMTEAANILHHASAHSVVILDEVGRGTSTYDGLSLAWAVTEHLATQIGCRTLFATHYHELTELEELLAGVRNFNVAVREGQDRITFLHKIIEGGTDKSYGVHVARLAGIPRPVIDRAREILTELESNFARESHGRNLAARRTKQDRQLLLFADAGNEIAEELRQIDLNEMTPLEAFEKLRELHEKAQ